MVDRLTMPGPLRPLFAGGRRTAFAALIVAVALFHLAVTRDIADRLAAAQAADAMPKRIAVTYVRTMEQEAPRAMATPVAIRKRAEAQPRVAAKRVATAASAPEVETRAEPPSEAASAVPTPAEPALATAPQAASDASPTLLAATAAATDAATPRVLASALASASAAAAAAASAAASSPAGSFAWPLATRVSYVLTGQWRGELSGGAEVEWIRVGERYQVNVDIHAGPSFAPIFTRRMTSQGTLGEGGLVPDRYDEDTQVLMRDRRRVSVGFEAGSVVLANGQRRERMAGTQDTASQFIQFTWLFGSAPEKLRVGNSFEFPLALPRSLNRWTYDVAGEETLYAPFGPITTFHLKPRRESRNPGEWLVEMWFAPELRFLPVRIRIEQEAGASVDLMIAKKPELAGS